MGFQVRRACRIGEAENAPVCINPDSGSTHSIVRTSEAETDIAHDVTLCAANRDFAVQLGPSMHARSRLASITVSASMPLSDNTLTSFGKRQSRIHHPQPTTFDGPSDRKGAICLSTFTTHSDATMDVWLSCSTISKVLTSRRRSSSLAPGQF